MIAAAVVITLLYVLAMLFLLYGFSQVKNFCGSHSAPKSGFSIVIPYRDEAGNLPLLFKSLLQLKYPPEMFEIIAVDDASQDSSEGLWKDFQQENPQLNLKLLQNIRISGSPKKDALALAIGSSKEDYILTTDADCELPPGLLSNYNSLIAETGAVAVAAPVALKTEGPKMSFLRGFQEMDFFSLQAATMGGFGVDIPFMCNGANFCYSKKAFLEVNGFEENLEVASGDDIFLLEKFQKKGLRTAFLKSAGAIVRSAPASSWQELFFQRVRWAAKTSAYQSFFPKSLGLLVFSMNLLLVLLSLLVLMTVMPPGLLLMVFLLKFNVDFYLIYSSARFFEREKGMKMYFLSSIVYPFFSSSVAVFSFFSGYHWKGRHFRK
ncbi:glycosyltransferase [Salinimicrobium tongyeongense]|uniref:Glycosyltransferase n=1 Tax=Salinimicrobium tongyeongense TaxID=2809707 RepID=A0ABY6NNL0_9FLAO|nr:glycosyltransferase [Salinimicrobium tongyeongense]UZH54138.1 glycosyltransferase [Salinimicrobium tongyeongense]